MTTPEASPSDPDPAAVMRMATAHLARYAASSAGLRLLLTRKVRRRCIRLGLEPPDESRLSTTLDLVIDKLLKAGLLDDAAFARSRLRRLMHKGLPSTRIRRDLQAEGLSLDGETAAHEVDDEAQARRFARRRRLGPYRISMREGSREKDVRAMLRAGFAPRLAMAVIDAPDAEDEPEPRFLNDT